MTSWPRERRWSRLLAAPWCQTCSGRSPAAANRASRSSTRRTSTERTAVTSGSSGKHRFSAFYGTDLEIILRGLGVTTVVITGVTTENCCHATARDAFFRDFQVVFLADATATSGYPDLGYGSMSADEVHRAMLVVLARDTADVIPTETFIARVATAPDTETHVIGDSTYGIPRAAREVALVR